MDELRILLLEDTPTDAELVEYQLRKAGLVFTAQRVDTESAFRQALAVFNPDIILADYQLPAFDGLQALAIAQECSPDTPYLFVTGAMGEELAAESIKRGAADYLLKDRLARLPSAVRRVLEDKRRQRQRHEAEEKFRRIGEAVQDAIVMMTGPRISFWNTAAERIFGYTAEEALGQEVHRLITPPQARAAFEEGLPRFHATGEGPIIGKLLEVTALRKGGEEFPVELSISAALLDGQWRAIGIVRDITERKRAETALAHANRALATLSAVNRQLVHASTEDGLLRAICQTIVEQRGYRMAWVGYVRHDEDKSVDVEASAGHDDGYLDAAFVTWADSERGRSPTGRAIRAGTAQVCQDIAHDPLNLPWREAALRHGYRASIALPLRDGDGTVFGALTVYAEDANAFSPGEIELLEEMASDLAFGVRILHTRQERDLALEQARRHLAQLRDSLEDTLRTVAATVEMRDPYTAGHQKRVADLASAIAGEMGLPAEQAHAINLASIVHDLGKIKIPAEILSKPGHLTDIEYSFIKIHAQAGYDILKGINFPWPIAQMVLQHHERLDGSGYPQGLRGDAILLEARIISVADTVDAISSHRPYRPGLGVDAALAEITLQRGIGYDPEVVDACLALFRERHYALKE